MSFTMNPPLNSPADPPRGVIYFCENRLSYFGGISAWFFFAPFLIGAVILESKAQSLSGLPYLLGWSGLLAYIIVFPVIWRVLLIRAGWWRRASGNLPGIELAKKSIG